MKQKLKFGSPKYLLLVLCVTLFLAYICRDNEESFPQSFVRTLIITSGTYYFLPLGELKKQLPFNQFVITYKKITCLMFFCIWIMGSISDLYDMYLHDQTIEVLKPVEKGFIIAAVIIILNVIATIIVFKIPFKRLVSNNTNKETGQ